MWIFIILGDFDGLNAREEGKPKSKKKIQVIDNFSCLGYYTGKRNILMNTEESMN